MFEQDFESMLRKYGDTIDDKKKFTGLVKDYFPDQAKTINLLLMAYNMDIAQDIRAVGRINNTFAFRFVKQMMDDYGLSRVNADWVVSVWCVCYGQNVLGKECEIKIQGKDSGPAIKEEKTSTKKYGDLFKYRKSAQGEGLGVCGFAGDKNQTIIFQNYDSGKPIIEICDGTFEGQGIEEAILTDGFQFVGKRAFADNLRLHQVVMPFSMKEIGDGAFENCTSLRAVSLPEQLERMGIGAFKNTEAEALAKENGADIFETKAKVPYTDADVNWQDKKSRNVSNIMKRHTDLRSKRCLIFLMWMRSGSGVRYTMDSWESIWRKKQEKYIPEKNENYLMTGFESARQDCIKTSVKVPKVMGAFMMEMQSFFALMI